MAPESISRGTMPSLHSKFITPNEAVQWVVENFEIGGSLERLENEISFERGVFHLYGRSEEDAKLHREHVRPYEQARDKIVSEAKQGVIRLLRSGHFIGIGLKMPIVANSVSGLIVPVFWNVLELDFDRMIATSEDMEYRNVQIIPIDRCTEEEVRAIGRRLNELARPDPLDAHAGHPAPGTSTDDELPMKSVPTEEAGVVEAEMEEGAKPLRIPESNTETHSFPGRPSKMRAVFAKHEERAKACQLAENASAESRWLENWVADKYPHDEVPKAKSIRNQIGSRYRGCPGRC